MIIVEKLNFLTAQSKESTKQLIFNVKNTGKGHEKVWKQKLLKTNISSFFE